MPQSDNRPKGFEGKGDSRLRSVVKRLREVVRKTQRSFVYDTLRLSTGQIQELTEALVEFCEDIHNNIGIWASYEAHNIRHFGTPLPITAAKQSQPRVGICEERIHHFLWMLYPRFQLGLILRPTHQDLISVVAAATECLTLSFSSVPKDSGVKRFLGQPNEYGWEVKRKLVWLGTQSYFFRNEYRNYVEENQEASTKNEIGALDDFICQECTPWSGLGAVDVLADVLDISEPHREDLRGWHERHLAPYRILMSGNETMGVLNAITGTEYTVRMDVERNPFTAGSLVLGSLVPWRGEWYWSGNQSQYRSLSDEAIADICNSFREQMPQVVSRYCPEYAARSREMSGKFYKENLERHGGPFATFPDGLALAADMETRVREPFRELPPGKRKELAEKHAITEDGPKIGLPDNLLHSSHEIGVFYSLEENMEIMDCFDVLVGGLQCDGHSLDDEEIETIRGFVQSSEISPKFVCHIASLYGESSFRAAFLLDQCVEDYCLEYLLRKFKGKYFRRRQPGIALK